MTLKRILITTGVFAPDIGGPASFARTLGIDLAQRGVAVTVLAYSSVRGHVSDAEIPFRVRRVWKRFPWGIRHTLFFFRALILMRHTDGVIALNGTTAGVPTLAAARLLHKPMVVRIAGDNAWEVAVETEKTFLLIDDFQKSPKSGHIKRLDRMQKRVCQGADAVIVPSHYLAKLVTDWGIPGQKVHVVYNGVDFHQSLMSKEEARRAVGISGNIILSAGRLAPWKGFRMLIKMMPQLSQVNQFFRLVIVGDGTDMATLRATVRNLGLERKVSLVGRKNAQQLAMYLAAADMFVLNTGYEGFSHQILEAMTVGVPVVTTTAGGNREIVTQGDNGLLVRYNDEFNLLEAIKAVWSQGELRERLVANAHHTVVAFSVGAMVNGVRKVLEQTFL